MSGTGAATPSRCGPVGGPVTQPPELALRTPEYVGLEPSAVDRPIHGRFMEIAAEGPDRTAVADASGALTYGELDRRSNRMARAMLARLGGGSEPVAMVMRDGIDAVAAILGILKAGKIFCPLDASLPPARIGEVVAHSGARLLVLDETDAPAAGRLPLGATAMAFAEVSGVPDEPLAVPVDADAPAWLYYTSGSTGRPKGVVQSHRRQLVWTRELTRARRYNRTDRIGLVFPLSFAVSTWPLFAALCNGGALHLWDVRRGGFAGVARWLRRDGITTLAMTPSMFREVAAAGGPADFASLRCLDLTVEPARQSDLELFRRTLPDDSVLTVHFGSSEAYAVASLWLNKSARVEGDPLPIGYPPEDTAIALIDGEGREVADGAVGEMLVASRAMALGYWRDAALSAAVFQTSSRGPGWVEYASGDLARRRPDGAFEFVGRVARRLKIDGQSVEPAEVERALLGVPGVRQAHARGWTAGNGDERLVAYVTGAAGARPDGARVRSILATLLPPAMVPSWIVVLDELPRNRRGKIDIEALPTPAVEGGAPPRDDLEAFLQAKFAAALGVDAVGTETDFFASGGGSLQALRLLAAVGRRVGRTVELPVLLASPTVRTLAAALGPGGDRAGTLVTFRSEGKRTPLFGVWDGSGEVYAVRQLVANVDPDRPAWGVRSPLLGGYRTPIPRLEAMAAGAVADVHAARERGPYVLAGYSFGGVLAFETAHQLAEAGDDVTLLVIVDARLAELVGLADHEAGLHGAARLTRELLRHVSALGRGDTGAAGRYVLERVRQRISLARLAVALALWAPRIRRGRSAPPLVRAEHFVRLHSEVWRRYAPRPYAGRTLLVAGGGAAGEELAAWRPLLTGEVEVEEVASCHEDTIREPVVGQVGRAIERVLARIEA
jgi:amino acid adenylation domain-containing protein